MSLEDVLRRLRIDEKGRLLFGDVPMILTDRDFIARMQKTIEELTGEAGAATILYEVGFESGYHFAREQARMFGVEEGAILRTYLDIASFRGWGKFEIVEYDEEKLAARVIIHASIAEEWGNVGRPVCHLWRGAIAGIIQYIADSTGRSVKMVGKEVKCIGKGDPHCEIIAEPAQI